MLPTDTAPAKNVKRQSKAEVNYPLPHPVGENQDTLDTIQRLEVVTPSPAFSVFKEDVACIIQWYSNKNVYLYLFWIKTLVLFVYVIFNYRPFKLVTIKFVVFICWPVTHLLDQMGVLSLCVAKEQLLVPGCILSSTL